MRSSAVTDFAFSLEARGWERGVGRLAEGAVGFVDDLADLADVGAVPVHGHRVTRDVVANPSAEAHRVDHDRAVRPLFRDITVVDAGMTGRVAAAVAGHPLQERLVR